MSVKGKVEITSNDLIKMCKTAVKTQSSWVVFELFTFFNSGDHVEARIPHKYGRSCISSIFEQMASKAGYKTVDQETVDKIKKVYKEELEFAVDEIVRLTQIEYKKCTDLYEKVCGNVSHTLDLNGYFQTKH